MNKKKKKNIIRYRRRIHVNIGIVIFAFVLIYFVISVLSYVTANRISTYEVQKGHIAKNISYTGLILREESVAYATTAGSVNYYKKEGDKAGANNLICSIDKTGEISSEISDAALDSTSLSKEELVRIQNLITNYAETYSSDLFYNVYSFKDSINANLQENLYQNALNSLSDQTASAISHNTFTFVNAQTDGILALYTDGYEDITIDNFEPSMYNPGGYTKTNLQNDSSVTIGQALYKICTSENWYIMVPLTKDQEKYYTDMQGEDENFVIELTFKKDNESSYVYAQVIPAANEESSAFLQLNLNSSMVRYISDRYVDIELGSDSSSGLKIPNSAIVEKDFLIIPKDYVGKGDNSTSDGVIKVTTDKKGAQSVEFIATDLYYETDDAYYISEDDLAVGDVIQKPDSTTVYTIKNTGTLKGVYNMNKGYAVFKLVNIVAENEEYSIVSTGTSYGLSLYDHIAIDGSNVNEGDFANRR